MRIVIANTNPVHRALENYFNAYDADVTIINHKEDFTLSNLSDLSPDYIFLPHWSYIIPKEIYDTFNCIVFHMTDLPYGRGGSPLQNLIVKGHEQTKISALRVTEGVDTGDIYLKKDLALYGTAEEIFLRASKVIIEMIEEILANAPTPIPQSGEVTAFKRRTPQQSDVSSLSSLELLHDHIRMLDSEGYPHAFLETDHFRIEFTRAGLKKDHLIADVRITKK